MRNAVIYSFPSSTARSKAASDSIGLSHFFVGVFVIGLVDNLLRPILVGRETQISIMPLSRSGSVSSVSRCSTVPSRTPSTRVRQVPQAHVDGP